MSVVPERVVTRSNVMSLISVLNGHQGTSKPEEVVAAMLTLFDIHPDYIGTTKVTAGRLRSQFKAMMDSPILSVVEEVVAGSLALSQLTQDREVVVEVPDAPQAIVDAYVEHGVSEHVVRTLWVRRPYWVKVQCKVFCELVRKGEIGNADAFLVSAVTNRWLLCSNYDRTYRTKQAQAQETKAKQQLDQDDDVVLSKPVAASTSKYLEMARKRAEAVRA